MEKMRIFNGILSLVIAVLLVVIGSSIGSSMYNFKKDMEITNQELTNLKYQNTLLKNSIEFDRMQMADLWLGALDPAAFDKISAWEINHAEFLQCQKKLKDMFIQRAYYTRNGSPGKLLVYVFEKGSLIYEKNGDAYCFIEPIDTLYATKGNCSELCANEEE